MASGSNASRATETSAGAAGSPAMGSGTTVRPAVDVTAITTRDDFLLELGECLGGQASVRPVESLAAAVEQVSNSRRAQVLVIDARDVSDVQAAIESTLAQAPQATVLVFSEAASEKQVGAAAKGSNVFAVLPIPLDKRKTGAVLEGAIADAVARKGARSADRGSSVSVEPFQPAAAAIVAADSGGPLSPSGPNRKGMFIGVGLAVVALAAGAVFFLGSKKEAPATSAAAPAKVAPGPAQSANASPADDGTIAQPAVETALINGKVDDLLEKGRLAMRERRYSEPVGDNALLYYRSAAAADPSNGEAADGLQRIAGVLSSRFDEAMNAGRFDEAGLALANLKAATPSDSRIPGLEVRLMTGQISKALSDANLDRANALIRQAQSTTGISADQINKWKAEVARRTEDAKVQRIAALVSDRIRDGRLVEPAEDSAKTYMQQLRELAPANATTQRLNRELSGAYLKRAREAALANKGPEVDHWLAEAKAAGVSAAEIASYQKDLASTRAKAVSAESDRLAQLVRDRMRDGRLTDPAQDSAAYYLGQIQSNDAGNANLGPLGRDFAAKLLDRARSAAQSGKGSAAVEPDLSLAKRWGADAKDIATVQQAASAPKSPTAGAARSSGGVNMASLAASLKRTRYIAPEFPSKALSQRVSGYVTVEYTVDGSGDTRDVRVVEATPPGVFDKAAVTAIKRWHYEPVTVNGAPVEIPVRTSIRFELPK